MRRLIVVLLAAAAAMLGLAAPASAETGGLVDWDTYYGSGWQGPLINDNLYIIDSTDSRFPVETVTSEWNIRTEAFVYYRWKDDSYDCARVHCAYVRSENLGATGWRVRVTHSAKNGSSYVAVDIAINTYYAWDTAGIVSKSGSCQAVGKGLGLDYTRSATDYKSCMSSAMKWTIGNALDDGYVAQLW